MISFLTFGCSSLFYYPKKDLLYDPQQINLNPQDLWIQNDDLKIHAWYFKSKTDFNSESKGTFVFFHGNAENLTSHYLSLIWLLDYNYDFVIFDYPGYGLSNGNPTPSSTVDSGKLVLNWVHKNIDPRPLIIYGQSLGGIISLKSIEESRSQIPLKTIIIDSSFNSYQKIAKQVLSRSWLTWPLQPLAYLLINDTYAPTDLSFISPIPILFIHGQADKTIELIFSEEMFAEAKEPKFFWKIPKGTHGSTFYINNGEYRDKLIQFLKNKN